MRIGAAEKIAMLICAALATAPLSAAEPPISGPLRVSTENPRYFADASGKPVYLTGAHTWANLQDLGFVDPPPAFDFEAHLDTLEKTHHNFIRLWRWEFTRWTDKNLDMAGKKRLRYCSPHPWKRSGPPAALDGKPKFDLSEFDESYFQRLRSRVAAAGRRGIYVSVMLFEGWGFSFASWDGHPFNAANNVQGVNGDSDGDGKGKEVVTLDVPAITRIQEAYARKVIDTLNDLDNVLYEIANECHPGSTEWQYHMIRYVHDQEKSRPKRHPVGMTFQYPGGTNAALFESPAEWISPNRIAEKPYSYHDNPPVADGRKVILADTDHLGGVWGARDWVWKSCLRGHNPIWMDPYDSSSIWEPVPANAADVRRNLGFARQFAERINLAKATPQPDLATTRFCLADPGAEYLIYQPAKNQQFSIELKAGSYDFEWFSPAQGTTVERGHIDAPGGQQRFKAPFDGDAVLLLKSSRGDRP
jgi:hypothetical protein